MAVHIGLELMANMVMVDGQRLAHHCSSRVLKLDPYLTDVFPAKEPLRHPCACFGHREQLCYSPAREHLQIVGVISVFAQAVAGEALKNPTVAPTVDVNIAGGCRLRRVRDEKVTPVPAQKSKLMTDTEHGPDGEAPYTSPQIVYSLLYPVKGVLEPCPIQSERHQVDADDWIIFIQISREVVRNSLKHKKFARFLRFLSLLTTNNG